LKPSTSTTSAPGGQLPTVGVIVVPSSASPALVSCGTPSEPARPLP
jgi:hypothetical protein